MHNPFLWCAASRSDLDKKHDTFVFIASLVVAAFQQPQARGETYELGGPGTYTFAELMQFILDEIDRPRFLVPLPWAIGSVIATLSELAAVLPLIEPVITKDQLIQLKRDNVVGEGAKSLADLGIVPETVDAIVPTYLGRYRRYGQFHEREAN